jgi:selenium-binding protein 1
MNRQLMSAAALCAASALWITSSRADETCNSPFMIGLIKGQEQYLQVWTLGEKGVGDESDKLVTVDVIPGSKTYGRVIRTLSVGGRGEAHHMGFTDDRKYLWAGRLDDNKIFVFDVGTDPSAPKLVKTIDNLAEKTGYVGPHTFYALPGRLLVQALSNKKDHGGATGLVTFNNAGDIIATTPMPLDKGGDGYGYDIAINPGENLMLTSSFTGWTNYMMDMGQLIGDSVAMKNFGATMVLWDLKAMKPEQVFSVPGAPLEIRWALAPGANWAVTATALTSKLYLVKQDEHAEWRAKAVADIGDPATIPLPVDISIAADAKSLWVNTFSDGTTRLFDLSNPEAPKQVYSKKIDAQVNMVSQSWDGKRVYFTSSLLANCDKKGADNEQFLKAYAWDGKDLKESFAIDFHKEGLGRAHHMKFTAAAPKADAK